MQQNILRCAVVVGGLAIFAPAVLRGQGCSHPECFSARGALELFAEQAAASKSENGFSSVLYILTRPNVSAARRDSVASGIEELALRDPNPEVRIRATLMLTSAGSVGRDVILSDAAPRLVRVYRASDDPDVREMVLLYAFKMADRRPLVSLLREVAAERGLTAQEATFNHDVDSPTLAVDALSRMGEEGRAVLRDLHKRRAVRSARASLLLDNLSRGEFRTSDPD